MATDALSSLFENLPALIRSDRAAEVLACSRETIYDMNYRPHKYGVPQGMFLRNGRRLLVSTDKLKSWFISRNGGKP